MDYLTCRAVTHSIHANTQTNNLFQFAKRQNPYSLIPLGMAASLCNAATVADCGNSRQFKNICLITCAVCISLKTEHTQKKIKNAPYNSVSGVMDQQQNTNKLTKLGKTRTKQWHSLTCGIKQKLLELS